MRGKCERFLAHVHVARQATLFHGYRVKRATFEDWVATPVQIAIQTATQGQDMIAQHAAAGGVLGKLGKMIRQSLRTRSFFYCAAFT